MVFLLSLLQCGFHTDTFAMLHAHIYMCEPSLHCQPSAALGALCILVVGLAVPCVCRYHPGSFCFIVLFLSQTDNFFTPHQRRLSPAERHLSALSRPPSIFPSLLCLFFPYHLMCSSSIQLHLTSCTESRICTMEKINTLSSVQTVSPYSVLSLLF